MVDWAILSALYGFFFPEQEKKDYDVTFKSDKKYWLGICVIKDGRKLSFDESKKHIENMRCMLLEQASERQVNRIVFYAPNPKRAKCYIAILHFVFDGCYEAHKYEKLISHVEESEQIKVIKNLDKLTVKNSCKLL
jgi:hypothetical protein